jgi:hypothetical protein
LKIETRPSADTEANKREMPNYTVKFTGRLSINAETEEEARETFFANILEVFQESDITDVTVSEEPAP